MHRLHITRIFTAIIIISFALSALTVSAFTGDSSSGDTKNYMWKITPKKDASGENIAYMLGALSVSRKDIYPLSSAIEAAYSDSDKIVVDLIPSETEDTQITSSLMQYGMLDQTTLDKLLAAQTYKKVDTLIRKYTNNKKSLTGYNKFKPWVIESLLQNLALEANSKYEKNGISSYFVQKAETDKKEILKIEDPTFQFKLLSSMSYTIQIIELEKTLKSLEYYSYSSNKLFKAWTSGDTDIMSDLLLPDFGDNDTLKDSYDQTLLERNKNSAEKIKKFLTAGGKYFIIADASLMIGNNSVLKLIADMGYTVEQM